MTDKILDFKSRKAYLDYLAWGYSHDKSGKLVKKSGKKNVFDATPGHMGARIRGKLIRRPYGTKH